MDQEKQKALQKAFGQNVKKTRTAQDLTQMQLAVKAETDIRQIQRIEAGEIGTSIAQAKLISDVLGVGLDELMRL
ncbi:MAG: helix-turn-helix transcriptional regulator [Bacteroidota bacterium]